jgi:translation initiation factor 2 alpha subunit (eIF-2alpha)
MMDGASLLGASVTNTIDPTVARMHAAYAHCVSTLQVHEKWRKRLQATMSADISQEVKICIEIALKCVESDRVKRPTINQIVDELDKIDNAKSSSTSQVSIFVTLLLPVWFPFHM